jgi:hypothetical protein
MTVSHFSPALFKTVREIELEQKLADTERALMRAKYGSARDIYHTPPTVEVVQDAASDRIILPRVARIETRQDPDMPHHVGVAAIAQVPQPFALHYRQGP